MPHSRDNVAMSPAHTEQERQIRQRFGDGLRRTYEPTVRAPLPSDWLKLLDSCGSASRCMRSNLNFPLGLTIP